MNKFICAMSAIIISAAVLSACGNDEGALVEHNDDAFHIVETESASTRPKVKVVEKTTAAVEETEDKSETTAKAADKADKNDESSQTATKYLDQDNDNEDTESSENKEPVSDNSGEAVEDETVSAKEEREEYYLDGVIYRKFEQSILMFDRDLSLMHIGFGDDSVIKSLNLGDEVRVAYNGYVLESYPGQIHDAYGVEVTKKAVYNGKINHFVCNNPAVRDSFTILLPDDWTVSEIEYPTEGDFTDWGFRIIPKGETTGLDITWHSSFSIREPYDVFSVTVNGYKAKKYGANGEWRFYGYDNGYVAANNFYGTDKYDEYADEFEFILNTLVFSQHEFIGE